MNTTKPIDDHFRDWMSHFFGYGYGTGEQHIIPALRTFLELYNEEIRPGHNSYRYETIDAGLSPTVTWLLINVLCEADILEYGTSPRYGWLTPKGIRLKRYMLSKETDDLYDIVMDYSEDYVPCDSEHCNCSDDGCVHHGNPFWRS